MEITDIVLIPVIVVLVDALKGYGLPKKWWTVVSVLLDVGGGVFYLFPGEWVSGVLSGLVMGLSFSEEVIMDSFFHVFVKIDYFCS